VSRADLTSIFRTDDYDNTTGAIERTRPFAGLRKPI
jgi:hypothetical protein